MYHNEKDLDMWWGKNEWRYKPYNITKEEFRKFPFPNGVTREFGWSTRITTEDINIGELVGYKTGNDRGRYKVRFVTHRVVGKVKENGTNYFITMGDCNICREEYIQEEDIVFKFMPSLLDSFGAFLVREGCREKMPGYSLCKGKTRDLCKTEYNISSCEDGYYCYEELAVKNNDVGICCGILNAYDKRSCQMNFAEKKNDISICCPMEDQYDKQKCFARLAVLRLDASFCRIGERIDIEDECKSKIAIKTLNVSLCDEMYHRSYCFYENGSKTHSFNCIQFLDNTKDYCYSEIAINLSNSSICNKIYGLDRMDECFNLTSNSTRKTAGK